MKKTFLILLVCFIAFSVQAQEQEAEQFKFDYTIPSKVFGDDREITVYLPPSYYEDPNEKFTVTYILDGHFDPFIDLGVKTIEYNTYMGKYTSTIIVGVHAKARGWEFSAPTPGDEDDENYKGGRAPELQKHFKNEIFPFIESLKLKTHSFRNLIGHSSGGNFVLYTLFSDEKDLFDAYIAISPGIRSDSEYILENVETRLKSGEKFRKFLYCSSGTVGEREEIFSAAVARLDKMIQFYPGHELIWRKSKFEGLDHFTCVGPSFNTSMMELMRAFRVDEQLYYKFAFNENKTMTEQIESFYKTCKENYGFVDIPTPGYLYRTAWYISTKEKNQEALEIYIWALKHYPSNYTLNKSKAKLQLKMGNKKAAQLSFTNCLQVLESVKSKMSEERYAQQKNYLEEKVKECLK